MDTSSCSTLCNIRRNRKAIYRKKAISVPLRSKSLESNQLAKCLQEIKEGILPGLLHLQRSVEDIAKVLTDIVQEKDFNKDFTRTNLNMNNSDNSRVNTCRQDSEDERVNSKFSDAVLDELKKNESRLENSKSESFVHNLDVVDGVLDSNPDVEFGERNAKTNLCCAENAGVNSNTDSPNAIKCSNLTSQSDSDSDDSNEYATADSEENNLTEAIIKNGSDSNENSVTEVKIINTHPLPEVFEDENSTETLRVDKREKSPIIIPVIEKNNTAMSGNDYQLLRPQRPKLNSQSLHTKVICVRVKPRTKSEVPVHSDGDYDERECLASAFQSHITDLVDGLVFAESELPDFLVAEDCLTEDECSTLRKARDRKDQIRLLVSKIKGRDVRVLQAFLRHIEKQNKDVAAKVLENFEGNKRTGMKSKLCALCLLKQHVDVRYVADQLWAAKAIDDILYQQIIHSAGTASDKNAIWTEVTSVIYCSESAQDCLLRALNKKAGLNHHAEGIQKILIENHGRLPCICARRYPVHVRQWQVSLSSEDSEFPPSTYSSTNC